MKKYVITGATSGIGEALAKEFSKTSIVFAGYRNSAKIDVLKSLGENVIPFYIDMTKPESISAAADFIKSKTEKIDTLINAAGCVVAGAVENLDLTRLRYQFEVNTFSHLQFSQELLGLLGGGKIINISSMSSFGIFPFISPYCASKRALDILFNSLEIETGRRVRVVSVKPGVIATPLWQKSVEENTESIKEDLTYEKEMKFMAENAMKNSKKGLDVSEVVKVVKKADSLKNPKSSYTVGKDARFAEFISKLPQDMLNSLIRFGLKSRIK